MSRAQRLLDLLQILRAHRHPVAGHVLARELGISLRSIYRDIEALKAQGAEIDGEAGLGYVLRSGFFLPSMMFTEEEVEALVVGSRWVAQNTDIALARAAQNALTKIASILPDNKREGLENSSLIVAPVAEQNAGLTGIPVIRAAIRAETILEIGYQDQNNVETSRRIWPFALGFFERVRVMVAWCEKRNDYRSFRVDRLKTLTDTGMRYPRRRLTLFRDWRKREGIDIHKTSYNADKN